MTTLFVQLTYSPSTYTWRPDQRPMASALVEVPFILDTQIMCHVSPERLDFKTFYPGPIPNNLITLEA
jgi:hypothetical protein